MREYVRWEDKKKISIHGRFLHALIFLTHHVICSDMQRRLVSSVSPAIRCGLIHGCPTSRILMAAFAGLAGVGAATLFYTQERTKDHQVSD